MPSRLCRVFGTKAQYYFMLQTHAEPISSSCLQLCSPAGPGTKPAYFASAYKARNHYISKENHTCSVHPCSSERLRWRLSRVYKVVVTSRRTAARGVCLNPAPHTPSYSSSSPTSFTPPNLPSGHAPESLGGGVAAGTLGPPSASRRSEG